MVPADPITAPLVVPLFPVSYSLPLFTPNARLFPHLSPPASAFTNLPLYRSALRRSPGVDRDTIISLSIDQKSLFWLRFISRY